MNMHTFRRKEIDGPETMNWTPVAVPVREPVALQSKVTTAQYLTRRAYRVGKLGASILAFLALGATGLWVVVDFVKLVTEGRKEK